MASKALIGGIAAVVLLGGGYAFASSAHEELGASIVATFKENMFKDGGFTYGDVSSSLFSNTYTIKDVNIEKFGDLEDVKFDSITFEIDGYSKNAKLVGYVADGGNVTFEEKENKYTVKADSLVIRFPDGTPWEGVNTPEYFPTTQVNTAGFSFVFDSPSDNLKGEVSVGSLNIDYDKPSGTLKFAKIAGEKVDMVANGIPVKSFVAETSIDTLPIISMVKGIQKVQESGGDLPQEEAIQTIMDLVEPFTEVRGYSATGFSATIGGADYPVDVSVGLDEVVYDYDTKTDVLTRAGYKGVVVKGKADGTEFDISLKEYGIEGLQVKSLIEFMIPLIGKEMGLGPITDEQLEKMVDVSSNAFGLTKAGLEGLDIKVNAPATQTTLDMSIPRIGLYDVKSDGKFITSAKADLGPILIRNVAGVNPQAGQFVQLFGLPADLSIGMLSAGTYEVASQSSKGGLDLTIKDYVGIELDQEMVYSNYREYVKAALSTAPTDPNMSPDQQVQLALIQILKSMEHVDNMGLTLTLRNDGGLASLITGAATMQGAAPDQMMQQLPLAAAGQLAPMFPNTPPEEILAKFNTFFTGEKATLSIGMKIKEGKTGADLQTITPATFLEVLDLSLEVKERTAK